MKQKIVFQNKSLDVAKSIALISSIMIILLLAQSSLFSQAISDTGKPEQDSLKDLTIHQEIDFKANPQQLYRTLLSSKEFSDCIKKSLIISLKCLPILIL